MIVKLVFERFKSLDFWIILILIFEGLFYFQQILNRHAYLYSDNAVYAVLSQRLIRGDFWNGIHTYWNPGFPVATIPFFFLTGSFEIAQVLVSIVSMLVLTLTIYILFKQNHPMLGLILGFLIAVSAPLHKLVLRDGITEPLYLTLLWTAIFLGSKSLASNKFNYLIYSTIFFALAYLTRTDGLPFFAFFILTFSAKLLFSAHLSSKTGLFKILSKIIIIVSIFLAINIPYIISQSMHIGRLTFSGKYAYVGSGPFYALESYRPTTWAQDVWALDFNYFKSPYYDPKRASDWMLKYFKNGTITQNAEKSLKEMWQGYRSINTDNFFTGWGFYLAWLGLALGLLTPKFRQLTLYFLGFWVIGVVWVATLMAPNYRYMVFALPFFIFLQGLSIYLTLFYLVKLLSFREKITSQPRLIIQTILLLIVFMIIFGQNMSIDQFLVSPKVVLYPDHKIIGEWIKSQNIKIIGGRMEGIEFYSDAKIVYMPSSPPKQIIDYMKKWGVEYLLVRPLEVGYEFVRPISLPTYKNPDLTLVKTFDDGSLIWKIHLTDEERLYNQRVLVEHQWN